MDIVGSRNLSYLHVLIQTQWVNMKHIWYFQKKTGVANIHNFLGDNKQYDIHLCLRLKQNETENPHGIELNSRISLILFLLATMIRIWL